MAIPLSTTIINGLGYGSLATTGAPAALGSASRGSSDQSARADHVHAHGNQAGGSLHATATTSSNGFMSSADKTKLDTYPSTAPAITGLTASQDGAALSVPQVRSNGELRAAGTLRTMNENLYFGTSGKWITGEGRTNLYVNVAMVGPAFTPTSDPDLKENIEAVSDDAAAVIEVLSAGQIQYDRVQDGVHALGFSAKALRDINPLWVVGGEALDPEGPPEDLEGAVIDEDGETFRRPLAVDPMAMISSAFAAVRQLANDTGYLEARHEQALSRIEALEATVAALTAA